MCVCVQSFAKFVIRQVLALTDAVDKLKRSVDRKTRSNEADQAQFKTGTMRSQVWWQLGLPRISVVSKNPWVFSIVGIVLIEAVGGKISLEMRVV